MLELVSIPAIATVVYWIINLIKYTTNNNETFKRMIPLTAGVLGSVLGAICFYFIPGIVPASNIFVALVIGAASGLTSVGANQIIKQATNEKENTENGK